MNYIALFIKLMNIWPRIQAALHEGGSVIDIITKLAPDVLPLLKEIGILIFPTVDPAKASQAAVDVFDSDGTKWVQNGLNALGQTPPLGVDGSYGKLTKAAVAAYQTAHGLKVDGWAGPKTSGSIAVEVAKLATT